MSLQPLAKLLVRERERGSGGVQGRQMVLRYFLYLGIVFFPAELGWSKKEVGIFSRLLFGWYEEKKM